MPGTVYEELPLQCRNLKAWGIYCELLFEFENLGWQRNFKWSGCFCLVLYCKWHLGGFFDRDFM